MESWKTNIAVSEPPLPGVAAIGPRAGLDKTLPITTHSGPDFCCVGAQKGGTGWLYEQLRAHPDFWMPPLKELHYFDRLWRSQRTPAASRFLSMGKGEGRIPAARKRARDERDLQFLDAMEALDTRNEIDLQSYAQLFAPKGALLSGDITPGYSILQDEIIERIVRQFPHLKVIFLARDPVERAWSQLSMWVRRGLIESFDTDDVAQVTRHLLLPEVLVRSHPSKIVARWRRYVRPEQFQLCFFDDLRENPMRFRTSIIRFLGADPEKSSASLAIDYNPKAKLEKLRLTDAMRCHIASFFEPELQACADELGGPALGWPGRYGL
jgi:hypothetical protein